MLDISLSEYTSFKVDPIKRIKQKYGFLVRLRYDDGQEVIQQCSGYTSKREASKIRDVTIGQLCDRTYPVFRNVKFADFMHYWVEADLKPTARSYETVYSYQSIMRNHIIPLLGKRKMDTLTPADIDALYREKSEYSRSVAEQVKVVITRALDYAVRMNVVRYNPAKNVRLPKAENGVNHAYHSRVIDEQSTLTLEQVQLLLEKSKGTKIELMLKFNVLMGLRRSEIIALKYSDIDYSGHKLRVERQLGRKVGSKKEDLPPGEFTKQEIPPKTRSSVRVLPIPDIVYEAILEERVKYERNRSRRSTSFHDDGYICCSSYGRPRSRYFHCTHFKALLKECDLPDIRWHDLRATYCTLLLKQNFSAKAVSRLMGHEKEIITVDVYGDKRGMIADGVPELDAFIERIITRKDLDKPIEALDTGIDVSRYVKPKD